MRPQVKLIEGRHITATDKRNILECIEYLRTEENHAIYLGRKGSPKRYAIGVMETPNEYAVLVEENYRDDYGKPRQRTCRYVVQVKGIEPLQPACRELAQFEMPLGEPS